MYLSPRMFCMSTRKTDPCWIFTSLWMLASSMTSLPEGRSSGALVTFPTVTPPRRIWPSWVKPWIRPRSCSKGNRSWSSLKRYTNLKPSALHEKYDQLVAAEPAHEPQASPAKIKRRQWIGLSP